MQNNNFCVEFTRPQDPRKHNDRRQSNSWDNDLKGLSVPKQDRRNSHTLAQLLECANRLSISSENICQNSDDIIVTPPPQRSKSSRRTSIAELSDNGITTKNSDDCVVLTQTLGTSTTYFFQKDPNAKNLNLRPSAVERGLYNFDDAIKESPIKTQDTPRPSIQLSTKPLKPSFNLSSCNTILEVPDNTQSHRPSRFERGLPTVKFPTTQHDTQPFRGRALHKHGNRAPRFGNDFDRIIENRRKKLEEEEARREKLNLIRPRTKESGIKLFSKPHSYNGDQPAPASAKIMDELRTQIDAGEVDRIVKEKKTTTLTPTVVPISAPSPKRRSITNTEGPLPSILDRPYVRAQPTGPNITRNVTIQVPKGMEREDAQTIRRTSQTSDNVRLLTTEDKIALRKNASRYEHKVNHPLDDAANDCRQS